MRKTILFLLLALTACTRPLFDTSFRPGGWDRLRPPPPGGEVPEGTSIWATAVAFHPATDWRAGETGGAGLLLFKDGVLVDSLPASDCMKPEQHRFRGGHLWTNTTDGFRTFIRRDGEPYLIYEGEESLTGFLVLGGHLHTLGQRPGGGFSYRIDGQAVFSSPTGLVLGSGADEDWEGGALCEDGGSVYYTYGLSVQSSDVPVWEYRLMCGRDIRKVITPLSGGQLYDVRVLDGQDYRLESRYGGLCILTGEDPRVISVSGALVGTKLVVSEGKMSAAGRALLGGQTSAWLFSSDGRLSSSSHRDYDVVRLRQNRGMSARVLCLKKRETLVSIDNGLVDETFPEGYLLYTPRCFLFRNGLLCSALTAESGDIHILRTGRRNTQVQFNGYFTGIYIE